MPFYVLGRELVGVYPVGFLAQRHALSVAIFSYNGHMHFGLLADRDTIGDVDPLMAHVEESIRELKEAAEIASRSDGNGMAGDHRPRVSGRPEGFIGA
jgi:hypothetical protein